MRSAYKNGVALKPGFLQVPTGGFSANNKLYAAYTLKNEDIESKFLVQDYNDVFLAQKKDGINLQPPIRETDTDWNPIPNENYFNLANWEIIWKSFCFQLIIQIQRRL